MHQYRESTEARRDCTSTK